MPKNKESVRRVCVVITDKAQLSRLMTLLKEIRKTPSLELKLIVGGGALTYRYGNVVEELASEGFNPDWKIPTVIEGADHLGMAKTAALGMLEFASAFSNLNCETVIVRGDRFEILPIVTAAVYQNIPVVHLEGGDRTGSIDESVRHAITKLAHLHFVTNAAAKKRVIAMGERTATVFNVGSLDIDYLTKLKWWKKVPNEVVNSHGTGAKLDLAQPYILVMQNPVTTEAGAARMQADRTLKAVHDAGIQAVWVWPNLDAGSDAIAKRMREWQWEMDGKHKIRFIKYLWPEVFLNVLNKSAAVIGNSSTGIKECSWMGVPAVNIGTRQTGRLRGENVTEAPHDAGKIRLAIRKAVRQGRHRKSTIYGNGTTAKKIVRILGATTIPVQKQNRY